VKKPQQQPERKYDLKDTPAPVITADVSRNPAGYAQEMQRQQMEMPCNRQSLN
jgi:hypothetical protein